MNENGLLTGAGRQCRARRRRADLDSARRHVAIGGDGTISTIANGTKPGTPTVLGRLKLVNPPEADLVRGDDGLFRLKDGKAAPSRSATSTVVGGALEGSNVNAVDAMVNMIAWRASSKCR